MLYFGLDHQDIGSQIATLLNTHNGLSTYKTAEQVLKGNTHYIVETHGAWVLGAVGIDRQGFTFTEIKHLVVRPDWRGRKLGKFLVRRALSIINTRMAYCTIRADNGPSLRLFRSLGFQDAGSYPAGDHQVVALTRAVPQWTEAKPKLKSSWSNGSV